MNEDVRDVRITDDPESRRYEMRIGDELAGELTYDPDGDRLILKHTGIDDRFEGEGLGRRLVAHVLDDVRSRGLSIVPKCPFVRAYIERNQEYADLVVREAS